MRKSIYASLISRDGGRERGRKGEGGGGEREKESRPIIIRAWNIVNQRLEKRESDDFYRDLVKAAWRLQRLKRRYGI